MMHEEEVLTTAGARRSQTTWLFVAVSILMACVALPAFAGGNYVGHNTPRYVATAKNLGTEDPSKTIEIGIWLNVHNREEMDALTREMYDRNSPNYRHFLNRAEVAARFAPTAEEAKTVQQFFESHNLKVVNVGPDNFFVRARGTVADVETAFHVQLNNYQVGEKVVRANASDPYVDGDAATLVRAVDGLDSGEYTHPLLGRPTNTSGGSASANLPAVTGSNFFSSDCFLPSTTQTISDGALPIGTYTGNLLNLAGETSPGCGYTPGPIQTAYNLTSVYNEGFTGTGQTIVILDWCGSPTIQSDANAFSKKFGLPALTSSNFSIIPFPTVSTCSGTDPEINIDVEWSHAIAPGASIDLVVPPSASFIDVNEAEFFAVNNALGNNISGSYASPEVATAQSELETENLISETAALTGISTNFATADDGDYTAVGYPKTVAAPADSPWATAVGGISLSLNSDNSIAWQAGWGNNEVLLADEGEVFDPPLAFGFAGGGGGGESNCAVQTGPFECVSGYRKPAFQSAVNGKYRQLPDVSWLADPFTGAVIAISEPGQVPEQVFVVYGGTSLATPMFSGLWAIANQAAGTPLGQAAPYLYAAPAGTFNDVVPVGSSSNVTASIKQTTGTDKYGASGLLGGATPALFVSGLWDYAGIADTLYVISFGTDCATVPSDDFDGTSCTQKSALHTAPGWDNVTGVGTPDAQALINYIAPASTPKK